MLKNLEVTIIITIFAASKSIVRYEEMPLYIAAIFMPSHPEGRKPKR